MQRQSFSSLRRTCALALALLMLFALSSEALALQAGTLRNGMRGESVREIQQALITLGYLKGKADGIFGNQTENAVRKFQKKNKLTVDGLVGEVTKKLLLSQAAGQTGVPTATPSSTPTVTPAPTATPAPETSAPESDSLFQGNYTTLRSGSTGSRVKKLQKALISLKYLSGSADGVYGKKTVAAVKAFQKAQRLKADGVAGKQTLKALEAAYAGGASATPAETPAPTDEAESPQPAVSLPSAGSLQLLNWYDQVKPALKNKQQLLIYDPDSGRTWTLQILSRGRHCDAEPLTKQDTASMIAAFGGKKTWTQKGVYVRLPDGRWTIGSTHDVAHSSSSIKNNNFNGHLCVHFLRPMEECKKNDPKYGVSNQLTLRALWKSLTGVEINY